MENDGDQLRQEILGLFAENLRRYRAARRISQEQLAHDAGLDRSYISDLERSIYAPGIDVVAMLARVLGVEAADLLRRGKTDDRSAS